MLTARANQKINSKLLFIDNKLRGLIRALNKKGFKTIACCQGKRYNKHFYANKHEDTAYIFFNNDIEEVRVEKLKRFNIVVEKKYNHWYKINTVTLRAYDYPTRRDKEGKNIIPSRKQQASLIKRNKNFVKIIKEVFNA